MTEERVPYPDLVANGVLRQIRVGEAAWQREWSTQLPLNPSNGERYSGINALHLQAQGYDDPRWMTLRQANATGGVLREGEQGTRVTVWQFTEEQVKRNWAGRPVRDPDGKAVTTTVRLQKPRQHFRVVFNASQFDGLPDHTPPAPAWDRVVRADQLLQATGARIEHHASGREGYDRRKDVIRLRPAGQHASGDEYYATALRSVARWTAHSDRLGRESHAPGTDGHARETLRAELGASLLGRELGLQHSPEPHADAERWERLVREDPRELFRAAADAEAICQHVLGLERSHQQAQAQQAAQLAASENDRVQAPPGLWQRLAWALKPDGQARPAKSPVAHFSAVDQSLAEEGSAPSAGSGAGAAESQDLGQELESDPVRALLALSSRVVAAAEQLERAAASHDAAGAQDEEVSRVQGQFQSVLREWRTAYGYELDPRSVHGRAKELAEYSVGDIIERAQQVAEAVREARPQQEPPHSSDEEYREVPDGALLEAEAAPTPERDAIVVEPATARLVAPESAAQPVRQEETAMSNETPRTPSHGRPKLAVPWDDRKEAGKLGARWDKLANTWYAKPGADVDKLLERWDPKQVAVEQSHTAGPREELADFLRSMGFLLDQDRRGIDHPVMNGEPQRCPVEGDKGGARSGFYVAHLDGRPAGYVKNNRSQDGTKWVYKGHSLSPEERARMRAVYQAKAAQKLEDTARRQAEAAVTANNALQRLQPVQESTDYHAEKSIEVHGGAYRSKDGHLFLPLTDAEGAVWALHKIGPGGYKGYQPGARKQGLFHVVGGHERLARADAIVIAEGYATAATVAEALDAPVVSAMDAGNVPEVAKALREQYPDTPILIAADDDTAPPRGNQLPNAGQRKAREAAEAVDGHVVSPRFATGEQARDPKGHSDFNDMATRSQVGRDATFATLRGAYKQAIEQHNQRSLQRSAARAPEARVR